MFLWVLVDTARAKTRMHTIVVEAILGGNCFFERDCT